MYRHQQPLLSWHQRLFRVVKDSAKSFVEDDCYARASALTFYSLFSIVPVFAVLFGIAKGFGFEKSLEFEINQQFVEQKELIEKLIQFSYSWLDTVRGGLIAGVGAITLFWSVFSLLNNIESALNFVWKTRSQRSYFRKMNDYLATMVISPILFVTSSSITVYLSSHLVETSHDSLLIEVVSPILLQLLKLFPFFLSGFLFSFLYLFLPNTKIYFRSACLAGFLAGSAFQIWQWIYIKFQIGAASYGAIYGSFAALPLFLIWLQVSWVILLAGAELAYQIENDLFIPNRKQTTITTKTAALLIVYRCVEAFCKGSPPVTDQSLGRELGISLYHLQNLLEVLNRGGILTSLILKDGTVAYQPAKNTHLITLASVCKIIDEEDSVLASVEDSPAIHTILGYIKKTEEKNEEDPLNIPVYTQDS